MSSDDTPVIPERRDTAEKFWLTPTRTPHSNSLLRGPTEDIGDLEVELSRSHGGICSDSAWALDDYQRELVAAGANIRLGVWQHPIPPLSVEIEAPFCDTCDSSMVYVKAEHAFFCAGACPKRDPRFGPSPVTTNGGAPTDAEEPSPLDQAHADFTAAPDDEQPGD